MQTLEGADKDGVEHLLEMAVENLTKGRFIAHYSALSFTGISTNAAALTYEADTLLRRHRPQPKWPRSELTVAIKTRGNYP
jgi:hypothetical protein